MTTKKTPAKKNAKKSTKSEALKVKSQVKAGTLSSADAEGAGGDSINCRYGTSSSWCC